VSLLTTARAIEIATLTTLRMVKLTVILLLTVSLLMTARATEIASLLKSWITTSSVEPVEDIDCDCDSDTDDDEEGDCDVEADDDCEGDCDNDETKMLRETHRSMCCGEVAWRVKWGGGGGGGGVPGVACEVRYAW